MTGTGSGGDNVSGIANGPLAGIAPSGASSNVMLDNTTVDAAMTGTGSGVTAFGISNSNLYGITLGGASDVSLTETTVDGAMEGIGATPIDMGDLFGIDVTDAANATLEDTTIIVSRTGAGGTDDVQRIKPEAPLPPPNVTVINPFVCQTTP